MFTWIAIHLSPHLPGALQWAAGQAGKIVVEKAKLVLTDRAQFKAYEKAVAAALKSFAEMRPELLDSFFDQHFLEVTVADEMLKLLTTSSQPDAAMISQAYSAQFPLSTPTDLEGAIKQFLSICEEEFSRHKQLQALLTNRQVYESVGILRRMDERADLREISSLDPNVLIRKFNIASQELLQWPRVLSTGAWIERPELQKISDRIDETSSSVTLLLGLPGSGKSALLSQLSSDCATRGWAVLSIKADQIPDDLITLEGLRIFLDLPAPIADCLLEVARKTKTVLVIDQLDALSELLDLKTQRLQVLLRLMTQVREVDGVHVVTSCRSFDRTYDSRLNSIVAEEITLELPSWEVVEETLKQVGVVATQWPPSFRELLRVPQCLKLFVRHFTGFGEQQIFESYQAMLEHLWSTRILGKSAASGVADLLLDIATEMAEREVMFVPSAKFDSRRQAVEHSVQTGFLQFDPSGRQITFSHQTIFDFVRARAFIAKEQSLSNYVLARQSGLYVRPKLWSALHYLRGSDEKAYETELKAIWHAVDLRPHINMLLIDFLGLQDAPSTTEIELLRPKFEDSVVGAHAFAAVAGRAVWFTILDRGALVKAMGDDQMAWPASRVLQHAWGFAPSRVLELIREHWVQGGKWSLAYQSLRSATNWDSAVLDVAVPLVRSGNLHASAVHDLATLASAQAPELAVELVAAHIQQVITAAIASRMPAEPLPDEASHDDALVTHIDAENKDELRQIIDSTNDWYELPAVAEAAPKAFLWSTWPPVRAALEVLAKETHKSSDTYRLDYISATRFEVDSDRSNREHPFMDSFVYAVKALGSQDPESLKKFVETNYGSESATVHRLLALGLCEAASKLPQFALDYLLGDVRRLSLENMHEDERETKMLIRAVIPYLDQSQLISLEQYILSSNIYESAAEGKSREDRRRLKNYNRLFHLRLLLQFPRDRLSKGTQKLIDSEMRLFPAFRDDRRDVELYASASAMTAEAMAKARPETIATFLAVAPDSTEWGDHGFPGKKWDRGSIQASRAFAGFAKGSIEKAFKVIELLNPKTQQRPAAYAIREWKKEHLGDHELVQLIKTLDARGFDGQEFRDCCASSLRERIGKEIGLSDEGIVLLERWLAEYVPPVHESSVHDAKTQEEGRTSVLWGREGFDVLPNGSYALLNAWFYGLLARAVIDSPRIFQGLRQHLLKKDNFEIWHAMAADSLTKLHFLDRTEAAAFLAQLFVEYPDLLADRVGQKLIGSSISWAPAHLTDTWIDSVRTACILGPQAYGELVTLRNVVLCDQWSATALSDILSCSPTLEEPDELVGALYAAANLWNERKQLSTLSGVLCRGMRAVRKEAGVAAIEWFSHVQELRIDAYTQPVLEAFSNGTTIGMVKPGTNVLDKLTDVLDDAPQLVGTVCQRILDLFKTEIGNLASGAALQSETLLSIALTLQRHEEPHRSVGLALFEQLLRYEAYRARDVLRDIDRRPGVALPQTQLRSRRRRRHTKPSRNLAI